MTPSFRSLNGSLALACVLASFAAAHGGSPSGGSSMPSPTGGSQRPENIAKTAFNAGVRSIKKAEESEADAARASSPEKSAKAAEKAQKSYQKAADAFVDAVSADPAMYEAWNYLGFAKRHLGNYEDSLSAYAKALELNPNYPDAIEYRGEAYLGLNKIDAAKEAYMSLFRGSRPLADELMTAMHRWIDAHRKDAQGVSQDTIEAFAKWMSERTDVAAQTASLRISGPRIAAPPSIWR